MQKPVLEYFVSRSGLISGINGPWDEFAENNGGADLKKDTVTGTNIFAHIKGDGVRSLYNDMHRLLFKGQKERIEFDYRCDTPHLKRFMTMEMDVAEECIRYRSRIIREEERKSSLYIDYESANGPVVLMCAWCKDFKYPENSISWSPVEKFFKTAPSIFLISHGICPKCAGKYKDGPDSEHSSLS